MELESLRGTNEYLERNLADIEKVKIWYGIYLELAYSDSVAVKYYIEFN